ncbi:uncharacterized protein DS421_16g563490 [Arachis hypogaea]|nr:uncharacterized protein DS421_16g563490 [Arachis hypogaea]
MQNRGLHLDEPPEDDDGGSGDSGKKGIGIKILEGGTTVLGLSRTSCLMQYDNSLAQDDMSAAVVPGLWDDLLYEHVAVPLHPGIGKLGNGFTVE